MAAFIDDDMNNPHVSKLVLSLCIEKFWNLLVDSQLPFQVLEYFCHVFCVCHCMLLNSGFGLFSCVSTTRTGFPMLAGFTSCPRSSEVLNSLDSALVSQCLQDLLLVQRVRNRHSVCFPRTSLENAKKDARENCALVSQCSQTLGLFCRFQDSGITFVFRRVLSFIDRIR